MRVRYKGLHGVSEIGFKSRKMLLADLFPTADEIVLSIAGCFYRLGESAAVISEVPDFRFEVVDTDRVLEFAVSNPNGDYVGLIIDILARDTQGAESMMEDVETTCGFVRARLREALGIMEMPEDDYVSRFRDSLRLMTTELNG